jgi:predicted amidohydrolase
MQRTVKISIAQILIEGGEPQRNIKRAAEAIDTATKESSDIIVFPETIDFAWTHPAAIKMADSIPGKYSDFFCNLASKKNIYICVGLTERDKKRFFNTALLINNSGEIIIKYKKINLLQVEQPFYEVGDILKVVDTKFGKIGINICADNYLDSIHIGKTLGAMGAQIILSPCSWTVDYKIDGTKNLYGKKWIKPLTYIANMFNLLIVSATSVGYIVGGPYEGKKMMGGSLALNNKGVLVEGSYNEIAGEIITFEAKIEDNREKGVTLMEKIKKRGFVSEIDLWKKRL